MVHKLMQDGFPVPSASTLSKTTWSPGAVILPSVRRDRFTASSPVTEICPALCLGIGIRVLAGKPKMNAPHQWMHQALLVWAKALAKVVAFLAVEPRWIETSPADGLQTCTNTAKQDNCHDGDIGIRASFGNTVAQTCS